MAQTPSTNLDALIAELLGDIGQLHDQVRALPDAFKGAMAPSLGSLVLASKEAQEVIKQLGEAEKISISNFTAAEKMALRDALRGSLTLIVSEILSDYAKELTDSARLHKEAMRQTEVQKWRWLMFAFASSLLACAIGMYGTYYFLGSDIKSQAEYGNAVFKVWNSLDAKTKEKIQAARDN